MNQPSVRPARRWLFGIILIGALVLAGAMALRQLRHGATPYTLYYLQYVVPMVVFGPLLVAENLVSPQPFRITHLLLDFAVMGLAASRMVIVVLPFSGHGLLLAYALFTARIKAVRLFAVIAAIHMIYYKLVVWSDPITPTVGIAFAAGFAWLRAKPSPWNHAVTSCRRDRATGNGSDPGAD